MIFFLQNKCKKAECYNATMLQQQLFFRPSIGNRWSCDPISENAKKFMNYSVLVNVKCWKVRNSQEELIHIWCYENCVQ